MPDQNSQLLVSHEFEVRSRDGKRREAYFKTMGYIVHDSDVSIDLIAPYRIAKKRTVVQELVVFLVTAVAGGAAIWFVNLMLTVWVK